MYKDMYMNMDLIWSKIQEEYFTQNKESDIWKEEKNRWPIGLPHAQKLSFHSWLTVETWTEKYRYIVHNITEYGKQNIRKI